MCQYSVELIFLSVNNCSNALKIHNHTNSRQTPFNEYICICVTQTSIRKNNVCVNLPSTTPHKNSCRPSIIAMIVCQDADTVSPDWSLQPRILPSDTHRARELKPQAMKRDKNCVYYCSYVLLFSIFKHWKTIKRGRFLSRLCELDSASCLFPQCTTHCCQISQEKQATWFQ